MTLLATTDQGQYSIAYLNYPMPGTNVFPFAPTRPYEALVFAYQAVDTGIIGTGTINGQGNVVSDSTNRPAGTGTGATRFDGPSYIGTTVGTPTSLYSWWTLPAPGNGPTLNGTTWYVAPQTDIPTSNGVARPWLVEFYECSNVLVNGITLVNSPMWNLVLRYSSHITVSEYTAKVTPEASIPHTDGIDLVGSSYATLLFLNIATGGDGVALKSGSPLDVAITRDPNDAGLPQLPTHDVKIANSTFTNGNGIVVGGEAVNGVYNVVARNVVETNTDHGLLIKSSRGRGSQATGVYNIVAENFTLTGVRQPLAITAYDPGVGGQVEPTNDPPQPITPLTPNVHDITISGLKATDATAESSIVGLPESCIRNVNLNNVSITGRGARFRLRNMTGTFTDVTRAVADDGPPFVVQENVTVKAAGATAAIANTSPLHSLTRRPGLPCGGHPRD